MAIYTCVLLDVDNTLLDFDAAERQALTEMLAEYDLPHDGHACEVYHKVNRELWDALAKGKLNKAKLFQTRFLRFLQAMDLPDNGKSHAMNDRYEELLATHSDLIPGALNALEESATQIASGNLDFTLQDTPLTEFNQALDSVDTMRSALKDSLVQQWDMQNQREIQIAALAHDLKTPLAVIQGNVELLQEEALSETAGESLEAIQRRLGQLSQYVLQLQQAACSQNQAEQPKVTPIHELIRRCTEEVSGLCRNKEITLTVFCPPFSARVHTETLRRALINLLDNAIRYCPPGKTVQLMGAVTETSWILKVSDEGPGFQAESLKHIGEPFYRYESARSSNGHAGLGLYTVSQAMQIEGGRMIPGNVPDGSGAQVILEFPLSSLADDSKTASAPDLKYPLEDQN